MDKRMYFVIKCVITFLLLMGISGTHSSFHALSADKDFAIEVSGTVVDAEAGSPLPGVNVTVSGRVVGTSYKK
jgi:hypothetical protein